MGKSSALNTSNERVKYTIEIIQNSQSIANNTSNVTVKVRFYRTNTGYESYGTGTVYCKINGTQYSASVTPTQKITNSGIDLFAKTLDIQHGTDGAKTLTCSAWININAPLTSSEQSYSQVLTTIPRYLSITQFNITNITETSMVVKWATSDPRSSTYYSFDNGVTWIGSATYGESLANDGKSGTFNIQNLTANTGYKIKIKIKRTDSGLWTESEERSFSTYDYPKPTSMNHFIIGNGAKITIYNPLGRSYILDLVSKETNTVIGTYIGTYAGEVNAEFKTADAIKKQYASIPNKQVGGYYAKVTCGSVERILDWSGTYKIKGDEVPTVNEISYKDADTSIVENITDSDQIIVQNQSNLQIIYEPATPNYSAGGIAKYAFELNGVTKESTSAGGTVNFGKVNSANNLTLTLTVTDSRGLTAKKTLEIPMTSHSNPTATVNLTRLNNYEDESYLTVDASISSVNNKNTMTIEYRYKLSTDEYSPFVAINNREKQTFYLDKNSIFIFNIVVTDIFGTKFDKEYILYKGVFPLFIDTEKNAVGINDFPAEGEALRVTEGVAHFIDGVKIAEYPVADYIVEQGTNGVWKYRKWANGDAECWCFLNWEGQVSTATNSGRYYGNSFSVTFPQYLFVTVPFVFVAPQFGAISFEVIRDQWTYASKEKSGNYYICTENIFSTSPEAPFRIGFEAKGKWK